MNKFGPAPAIAGREQATKELVAGLRGRVPEKRATITRNDAGETIREKATVVLRTEPVAWAMPMDEVLFARFFTNYVRLRVMPWDDTMTTTSTYITEARNTLHQNFIEESDCGHLVMLDSDVLPPLDFVERLLAHKLPMVGGWYRKKGEPYPPCVYDFIKSSDDGVTWWKGRKTPGVGLERVDGAGAGCWVMDRATAIALGKRPFDPNVLGEDFVLCRKLATLGIPVHIDWSVACAHAGVAYT